VHVLDGGKCGARGVRYATPIYLDWMGLLSPRWQLGHNLLPHVISQFLQLT
jgi:hypothetical protein